MSIPEELRPFLRTVRHRRERLAGMTVWHFEGRGCQGIALLAGMGGAAPRRLAQQAIAVFGPDWVGVAGFGGAITALPGPGGVVVAGECWRLSPSGRELSRQAFHPAAPATVLAAHLAAQGLEVRAGAFVTTARMTAKASLPKQARQLICPVLDLETAEIAAAAQDADLPLVAVRAITDVGGEEIQAFLADMIDKHHGVPLARLLPKLWGQPRRLRYLMHLWRRSRLAGGRLAMAVNLILDYFSEQSPRLRA